MKIYDDHFYCFSCQCGGDVINLTSQLFSLSPLEATKKLQVDFGIADVQYDKEQYQKERNTRMSQLLKEKQFESWKHNTYLLLTDYCSLLREWKESYSPKNLDEPITAEYVEALQELEKMEYYCDLFLYGNRVDLEDFKLYEERLVKRIEQRIREHKQQYMGSTTRYRSIKMDCKAFLLMHFHKQLVTISKHLLRIRRQALIWQLLLH